MMEQDDNDLWPFIASIIYTAAWSISFYGQIYENYKLKSVQGFELNYLVMNISGYTFYGIYSTVGYFTNITGAGTVVIADLIFVYHALVMVLIVQTFQVFYYPRGKNRVSGYSIIICMSLWLFVLIQSLLTVVILEFLMFFNGLSFGIRSAVQATYSPAVYWNYKRKSTKGWSIFNIILDLIGASFSMASGGLNISNGLNITKVALAFLTIFYDIIFIIQHYILYRKPYQKVEPIEQSTSNIQYQSMILLMTQKQNND